MEDALVGYTGFVGGNLSKSHKFGSLYNSKNISDAYGTSPDLLVYAGVRAEMFTANKYPEVDLQNILGAFEDIRLINPKKLVLISTISVYPQTKGMDENSVIDTSGLPAYGANRLKLEQLVRAEFPDSLIVRLPALFGAGIKKNFVYDLIHIVPMMLKQIKYDELIAGTVYADAYTFEPATGFYRLDSTRETQELRDYFQMTGFTALNFTDSRSRYQFFNLGELWGIIETALRHGVKLLNVTSEPIAAADLHLAVTGRGFVNEVTDRYPDQDLRSVHAGLFGGHDGYIFDKQTLLDQIKEFVCDTQSVI